MLRLCPDKRQRPTKAGRFFSVKAARCFIYPDPETDQILAQTVPVGHMDAIVGPQQNSGYDSSLFCCRDAQEFIRQPGYAIPDRDKFRPDHPASAG